MNQLVLLFSLSCCLCLYLTATQNKNSFSPETKIKLDDLNADCLLQILECLKYHDLLQIAQTNHYFKTLARNVFRRMYSSKSIEIVLPYTEDSWHSIVEIRSGLMFESYDLIEQTFKIFGNLIKSIEVRKYLAEDNDWYTDYYDDDYYDDYHTEQHRQIYQLIYKYCSESLIALKLNQCDENISLYIDEFFKRIPQLRDLVLLQLLTCDIVESASENLSNLEKLELDLSLAFSEFDEQKLHFGRVKTLKMDWGQQDFSELMTFDQLQSLELKCAGREGVDFAIQFPNLTTLHLIPDNIEKKDIVKIATKLTNLKDVYILINDIDIPTIVQLMQRNKQLEKLTFSLSHRFDFQSLVDYFDLYWSSTVEKNKISMIKKYSKTFLGFR